MEQMKYMEAGGSNGGRWSFVQLYGSFHRMRLLLELQLVEVVVEASTSTNSASFLHRTSMEEVILLPLWK